MTSRQRLQDTNRRLPSLSELSTEIDQIFEMPDQRTLDTQLLKLYIDTVPIFDGNNLVLHSFIETVRSTFLNFPDDPHHVTHNLILQAVKNKLRGRAQSLIASRTDLTDWTQIEQLLKLTFGDKRDLQYLTHQLTNMKPNRNERPYDFGLKLQELRAVLIARINSDFPNPQVRDLQIENYNNIVKTIFITNLPLHYYMEGRIKNSSTLEEALNFVLEEEEFQNFAKLHQSVSQPPINKFNQIVRPNMTQVQRQEIPRMTQTQNYNQYPGTSQSQNQNFASQPQKQNFPSMPINIQPRPIKQNFPTNKQVFGPPNKQNVWRPNQITNLPKPTPMSGVSSQPKSFNYIHNTEVNDSNEHDPPYSTELYRYKNNCASKIYNGISSTDLTLDNYEQLPTGESVYYETQTTETEPEQNFQNAEPTEFPT